ncbi:HD domain-containing protein [Lentzea sp. HUAS TT2]|uniref:HD domain-containing protein n=1 Tax=Lentzea sp. HUAS TT2 TaxID=3447454 RepID=UPI003F7171E4
MRRIWDDAVRTLGGAPDAGDLMERYAEPHRTYHNTFHVVCVVRDSSALADAFAFTVEERSILALAACAHDVIYEGKPGEDERASAAWARERLAGVEEGHIARVESLVLATITHASDDPLAHVLLDADLAILGSEPEHYERYSQAVRQEYSQYDDPTWRAGRSKVLKTLLDREVLFVTEPARQLWDAAARLNLARELQSLA